MFLYPTVYEIVRIRDEKNNFIGDGVSKFWKGVVNMKGKKILNKSLVIFRGQQIRRAWYNNGWWFVIVDIIKVLTDSINPKQYIKNMRNRDEELSKGWGQIEHPLLIDTAGGKQKMSCANTEGIFRIIQSIPSKKAEPFKLWLAKVGYERVQEIENPELAQERMKAIYEQKGYPKSWIEKRIRGITIRQDLTDEWKSRGIEENKDFAILTNEIAKAAFGVGIDGHKRLKGLEPKFKNQNLRDHMTDLELIFGMLGEASTSEIVKNRDVKGFGENLTAARLGGNVAGDARKDLEKKSGKKVISRRNASDLIKGKEGQDKKRLNRDEK